MLGFLMHFLYAFIMFMYVYNIYVMFDMESAHVYEKLLLIAVIYPAAYDSIQLYKTGPVKYLSEPQNYSDLIYIYGSVLNVIL